MSQVGQLYKDAKVEKKVYGNSYLIRMDPSALGLLHKSNIPKPEDLENAEEQEMAEEETKDLSDDAKAKVSEKKKEKSKKSKKAQKQGVVNSDKDDLLTVGQTLPEVRVKEFNFFDGMPLLSMMPSVVGSSSLDYRTLTVGEFHNATIEKVHDAPGQPKRIVLKLNDFVRGVLALEHMADHPLKVIPPKLAVIGKEIKVRVFNIEGRHVEFTKKDSLIKDSVTVYRALADLRPGMKLQGVVVAKTEHGFVVRTFSGLKGLLTHVDIKENGAKKLKSGELKPGSALKAYV